MQSKLRVKAASFGLVTLAAVVAASACGEALRLEPPVGNSSSSTGAGGDGGGGVVACVSNSDCPAPTSVCDTVKSLCVECLVVGDCGQMEGTVCSEGMCVCPDAATWCGPDECVDLQTSSDNCGSCDHACFGSCVAGACADPWEPVAIDGAPSARSRHISVWTGSQMIVWGGTSNGSQFANLNDGAIYDPATSSWTDMSAVDAPSPRQAATGLWTGEKLIVWGGLGTNDFLNDGAMFDPAINQWEPLIQNNAPPPRQLHTAVWADSVDRMVVWGGSDGNELNSGGVYDLMNGWVPTAALPTPAATRRDHSAVWNGSQMFIYGGVGDAASLMLLNQFFPAGGVPGGRQYNPLSNSWDIITSVNEPPARAAHTALWNGDLMLLFGGVANAGVFLDSGFKYDGNSWSGFSGTPPEARSNHTAVWLEASGVMLVWGGQSTGGLLNSGQAYVVADNKWDDAPLPTVLEPRLDHSAVSTGDAMIVWGGTTTGGVRLNTGAIYRP